MFVWQLRPWLVSELTTNSSTFLSFCYFIPVSLLFFLSLYMNEVESRSLGISVNFYVKLKHFKLGQLRLCHNFPTLGKFAVIWIHSCLCIDFILCTFPACKMLVCCLKNTFSPPGNIFVGCTLRRRQSLNWVKTREDRRDKWRETGRTWLTDYLLAHNMIEMRSVSMTVVSSPNSSITLWPPNRLMITQRYNEISWNYFKN